MKGLKMCTLFPSKNHSHIHVSDIVRGSHTGQYKSTSGCYNELVVAIFCTHAGVKCKKKSTPADFIIYL